MNETKDYFSKQSKVYSQFRPTYPSLLFKYLAGLCRERTLAWDAATGNGQCAISLAKYFKTVIATDISENQLSNASQKENIIYKIERAEECSLQNNSVDLVTVATAIHWFDIPAFYKQVNRVLKQGGVLAVWSYAGCSAQVKEIDDLINHFAYELLESYWPHETELNWKLKYRTLPFPYKQIDMPPFYIEAYYTFNQLINYMESWSAVQRYKDKHANDPILIIHDELLKLWGYPDEKKLLTWELYLKCGYK